MKLFDPFAERPYLSFVPVFFLCFADNTPCCRLLESDTILN